MDSVDKFKLAAALFIWALGLIGGIAPLLSSQRVSKRASSILNMVAAGIFLASSCMHLLPDAQNNAALTEWGCEHTAEVFLAVRTRYDGDNKRCFKWANFFYGCGFLMVLLIEVLAHTLQRHYSKVQNGHRQQEHDALLTLDGTRATEVNNLAKTNGHSHGHAHGHSHGQLETGDYGTQGASTELTLHAEDDKEEPHSQLLSTVAIFSLMTPTGILFGRLLVDTNHATPAGGVCAAFAGGTFLFVAIMEIIPQELQDPRYQIEKCSALLAGYGAMGVLSLWT
ncbi:Exoglucanase 1 [Phytophthora nicotianae]|uniref:Exoglucanase 1 n=1 Tax=Phytophthora nicotianae TaxID=4792 RepID=A0A0W8CHM3_PHYNI|nr:hypothetical protein AM588_10000561 [Phytophthora nicotianae]KUF84188.1 Exoglucanase 1 [Phytophthora nicotianae]